VIEVDDKASSVVVWAARGGHGATTIAGAIGRFLGSEVVGHEAGALQWLWGRECPLVINDALVFDAGALSVLPGQPATNVVVLRGPCSLALRTLAPLSSYINHLVLIREPWRPLRNQDVEAVLGTAISAEVPHSPRIARLIDAGLLQQRLPELDEFAQLKTFAVTQLARAAVTSSTPRIS